MSDDDSVLSDEIVYHYTSSSGLLGIIDAPMKRIGGIPEWLPNRGRLVVLNASDVRYMNDSKELRALGDRVAVRLEERIDEIDPVSDPAARTAAEAALDIISSDEIPFGGPHRAFAVCFCSDGDLLSQWRGYAGNVGGYAIGFRRKTLQFMSHAKVGEWSTTPPPVPAMGALLKVDYEHPGRHTESVVSQILSMARDGVGKTHPFPPLFMTMSRLAQYKDESFREEQEWRLVYEGVPVTGYSMPVNFRSRPDGIVPYIPIVIGSPYTYDVNPNNLNFDEVVADFVVGPGPDMKLRVDAAKSLLHRNGHDPEVVRESRIPFKG